MKITILPSDKGDCLFITGADGKTILADGGMSNSYTAHVRPFLGKLFTNGTKTIDLVYLSHIDQDHIAGVLKMMDDLVAWRVYDHKTSNGGTWPKPKFPRPPEPKGIWHNSFHEQLEDNAAPIESALAAAAARLANSSSPRMRALATEYRQIAASIPEAIKLSRRIGAEQLGIPLNKQFGGKLAMIRSTPKAVTLGGMKIRLIGPFAEDLEILRAEWNKWLQTVEGKEDLEEIRRKAEEDEELLGTAAAAPAAAAGGVALAPDADGLGDRDVVTEPNLASLMLLIEEGGFRVVMTGDGHAREILRGLQKLGALRADGTAHVDVLKIQHHGSEHNIDRAFAKTITADHYIFCGNGKDENPDLRVVRVLLESRRGTPAQKSQNPEVNQPFKVWFSSGPSGTGAPASHMKKVETLVKSFANKPNSKMKFSFQTTQPLELDLV